MQEYLQQLSYPDSELVLGIVSPVGVDLAIFDRALQQRLERFKYKVNTIRLSEFLKTIDVGVRLKDNTPAERIDTYMSAGNKARELAGRGDVLALYAAQRINAERPQQNEPRPLTVHILRSLKHPDEVRTLRRIYGTGFFLVAASATQQQRLNYLKDDQGCTPEQAERLIRRDEDEAIEFGQKTRETFQLADVFVPVSGKEQLWRFLDLIFGAPFETPSQDEYGMFLAFAASLRSADLSRQVGAVILSAHGELISTGTNDVPASGGGLYWPGKSDKRDWKRKGDENERRRNALVVEIMKKAFPEDSADEKTLLKKGKELFSDTSLMNITEFGRAVHAEMEALLSAARSGISPLGGTLYTTTFPCHNCAKHIVASGIKRVVYVEPYPKSQAIALHGDSITLTGEKNKVMFEPFHGVGPRRFFDLFSVGLSSGYKIERKADGRAAIFDRSSARLRVPMPPTSYIEREKVAASDLVTEEVSSEENHTQNKRRKK